MYENSYTGMQKAAHERMLNGQGRKVVKEKVGNQMNSFDYYKNMNELDGDHFDNQWSNMAKQLGFQSNNMNNRLEYGGQRK